MGISVCVLLVPEIVSVLSILKAFISAPENSRSTEHVLKGCFSQAFSVPCPSDPFKLVPRWGLRSACAWQCGIPEALLFPRIEAACAPPICHSLGPGLQLVCTPRGACLSRNETYMPSLRVMSKSMCADQAAAHFTDGTFRRHCDADRAPLPRHSPPHGRTLTLAP